MPKVIALLVLALAGLVCASHAAHAEDIAGRWINRGSTPDGGRYSLTVIFDGKGKVETEASVTSARTSVGSGAIRCSGLYKLEADNVEYEWASCRSCPVGKACTPFPTQEMGLGGPVRFEGSDLLHVGPETFRRERR